VTVTETLLRKRKPNAYGIALAPATPVYFGFHYSATGFGATLYAADGSWVSDRGEIATGDTLDSRATCIVIVLPPLTISPAFIFLTNALMIDTGLIPG